MWSGGDARRNSNGVDLDHGREARSRISSACASPSARVEHVARVGDAALREIAAGVRGLDDLLEDGRRPTGPFTVGVRAISTVSSSTSSWGSSRRSRRQRRSGRARRTASRPCGARDASDRSAERQSVMPYAPIPSATLPTCWAIWSGWRMRDLARLGAEGCRLLRRAGSSARRARRAPRARPPASPRVDLAQPRRLGREALALAALQIARLMKKRKSRHAEAEERRSGPCPSGLAMMSVPDRARGRRRGRGRLRELDRRDGERVAALGVDPGQARDRLA